MHPLPPEITWRCASFDELDNDELYDALQLRQMVFILEQKCLYLDADGLDTQARHLLGRQTAQAGDRLVAYARLLPPALKYAEASIGRVVTHPEHRAKGAGVALMREAMTQVENAGWGRAIRISAQMYLEGFYEKLGFHRISEPYLDDGIWHVDMLRD